MGDVLNADIWRLCGYWCFSLLRGVSLISVSSTWLSCLFIREIRVGKFKETCPVDNKLQANRGREWAGGRTGGNFSLEKRIHQKGLHMSSSAGTAWVTSNYSGSSRACQCLVRNRCKRLVRKSTLGLLQENAFPFSLRTKKGKKETMRASMQAKIAAPVF